MTDSAAERVARFVDDLLHGRRPRRFNASQEEVEAMTAAAGLVAGRVGADIPDKAALDRIHGRLSEALDESPVLDMRPTRRTWLRTLGTAAAAGSSGVHWTRWRRISRLRARMAPRPQFSCQTTERGVG